MVAGSAPSVLVRAVKPLALVAKLAWDVGMHIEALVAILALREVFTLTFLFEVSELALSIRLVTVRPAFAPFFTSSLISTCLLLAICLFTCILLLKLWRL